MKAFFCSARIVNIWNSLPNSVVDTYAVNAFKSTARSVLAPPSS